MPITGMSIFDIDIKKMAPQDGFEPPAKRLTVACSTAELLGITLFKLDNQT